VLKRCLASLFVACISVALLLPGAPANASSVTLTPVDLTPNLASGGGAPAGLLPPTPQLPALDNYPTSDPSGWSTRSASTLLFKGTADPAPPSLVPLYCVQVNIELNQELTYAPTDWSHTSVTNLGYVMRLLVDDYPATDEPAGTNPNTGFPLSIANKIEIVQAAIWYFTDDFVVKTSDPFHDFVAAEVNKVLAQGPADQLPYFQQSLNLGAPSGSFSVGQLAGPFTISSTAPGQPVTVHVTNGSMFSDATGTTPIANGASIAASTKIWVRAAKAGTVTVSIDGALDRIPVGTIYQAADSQELISAGGVGGVPSSATASVRFAAAASSTAASSTHAATTPPASSASTPGTATASDTTATSPVANTGATVAPELEVGIGALVVGLFLLWASSLRRGRHRAH
jgi:hypothetical protein